MKYLNNEMILENGSIGNWIPSEDSMSGTIEWCNPQSENVLLATPNWEEDGIVPIDMSSDDGMNYENVIEVVLSGSKLEQIHQYETIVESVLANI